MNPRVVLALPLLLAACESSSTTSSSSSSGESCDSFLNQDGLGSVTLTVENQRTERVVLPSPCCNPRPPQMEVSFGAVTEAPSAVPSTCGCTCESFMTDGMGCGCSVDQHIYRLIEPGGSVAFDWPGTYIEEVALSGACASSAPPNGYCDVERPVPAGEVTFTLHLLTAVNLSGTPDCDPYCVAGSPLEGQTETVTSSVDFAADGAQSLTVTVD